MNELSPEVLHESGGRVRAHGHGPAVAAALDRLQVADAAIREFFERHAAPFWSVSLCYELLDPIEGRETIGSITDVCRNVHGFGTSHVVLTQLSAGEQVVVLDRDSGRLYEVDFEADLGEFLRGELAPRWADFREFREDFFD